MKQWYFAVRMTKPRDFPILADAIKERGHQVTDVDSIPCYTCPTFPPKYIVLVVE